MSWTQQIIYDFIPPTFNAWYTKIIEIAQDSQRCLLYGSASNVFDFNQKSSLIIKYYKLPKTKIQEDPDAYKDHVQFNLLQLDNFAHADYAYYHAHHNELQLYVTKTGAKKLELTDVNFNLYKPPLPYDPNKLLSIWYGYSEDDDEYITQQQRSDIVPGRATNADIDVALEGVTSYLERRWYAVGLGAGGLQFKRKDDAYTNTTLGGSEHISETHLKGMIPDLYGYPPLPTGGQSKTRVNYKKQVIERLKMSQFTLSEICDMSIPNPLGEIDCEKNIINVNKGMLLEQPGLNAIGIKALKEINPMFIIMHFFFMRCGSDPYAFLHLMVAFAHAFKGGSNKLPYAIVFQGEKQSLKTADAYLAYCNYRPEHSKVLSNTQHVTGRNTYTMRDMGRYSIIFVDEAFAQMDPKEQALMRNLVTERTVTERSLYKDPEQKLNNFNLLFTIDTLNSGMSSGLGSRRWLVCICEKLPAEQWQRYMQFYLSFFSTPELLANPNKSDFSTYTIEERSKCPGMMCFYSFFKYLPTVKDLRTPPYSRTQVDFDIQALQDPTKILLMTAIKDRVWTQHRDKWAYTKDGSTQWNSKHKAYEIFFAYEMLTMYYNALDQYETFKEENDEQGVLPSLLNDEMFTDEMQDTLNYTQEYLHAYVNDEPIPEVAEGQFILPCTKPVAHHDYFCRDLRSESVRALETLWGTNLEARKESWMFALQLDPNKQEKYISILDNLRRLHNDLKEDQFTVGSRICPKSYLKWRENTMVFKDFFGTTTVKKGDQNHKQMLSLLIDDVSSGKPMDYALYARQQVYMVETALNKNLDQQRGRQEKKIDIWIFPRFGAVLNKLKGIHTSYFYNGLILDELNMADISTGTIHRLQNHHFAREALQALYNLEPSERTVRKAVNNAILKCLHKGLYRDGVDVNHFVDEQKREEQNLQWKEQWDLYERGEGTCPMGNLKFNEFFPPTRIKLTVRELNELDISIEQIVELDEQNTLEDSDSTGTQELSSPLFSPALQKRKRDEEQEKETENKQRRITTYFQHDPLSACSDDEDNFYLALH